MAQNSWQAHFGVANTTNKANGNFAALIDALNVRSSKNDRINSLTKDADGIVMVLDDSFKVKIIHSCKKIGGTCTNPIVKMGWLTGLGARALPIIVNPERLIKTNDITIPTDDLIWACNTIKELKNLGNATTGMAAPAAPTATPPYTRTRAGMRAGSSEGAPSPIVNPPTPPQAATQTLKEMMGILPIPFLGVAVIDSSSNDPIELILCIKNAAVVYNNSHPANDATTGAKSIMRWLYATHKKLIDKTRLSVEPKNKELLKHANKRHHHCILPPLKNVVGATRGSIGADNSILCQLISATSRSNKAMEATNIIRQKEYDWKKDIEFIKKDRTKDLHLSIKRMIENASATEQDKSGKLGEIFITLFNSKTHSGCSIQLHQYFEDVGMGDVTFAKGVSTNLWAGNFTRQNKLVPGAFSPFSFRKASASTSTGNKNRSLLLKIFSSAKGGLLKKLDKVKASAKTTVTVPQDFHKFVFQIKAFAHATGF